MTKRSHRSSPMDGKVTRKDHATTHMTALTTIISIRHCDLTKNRGPHAPAIFAMQRHTGLCQDQLDQIQLKPIDSKRTSATPINENGSENQIGLDLASPLEADPYAAATRSKPDRSASLSNGAAHGYSSPSKPASPSGMRNSWSRQTFVMCPS